MSKAARQHWLLTLVAAACAFSACNTPLLGTGDVASSGRLGLVHRSTAVHASEPELPAPAVALATGARAVDGRDAPGVEIAAGTAAPAGEPAPGAWIEALLAERARALDTAARAAIADQLLRAERELGLEPLLVLAVMAQESRFDPRARGPRGSLGLMQVRPFVGRDIAARTGRAWDGPETLLDPARNVELGITYLAEMIGMFDDVELALAAYNMGPYRLRRMLRRGVEPRGRYAGRVLAHHADLTAQAVQLDPGVCPADYC